MTLTLQDKCLNLDKSPVPNKSVTLAPTAKDPFIKQSDASYKVGEYSSFTVTTGADGLWTATLPWPSETRQGTALQWQVTLPDGALFAGIVPEGELGPLSLDDLMQSHGWGVVPIAGTPVVVVVGPTGPQGSPGGNAIATPTVLGGVYVDQSPPLGGVPTTVTVLSIGQPNGVAGLDSSGTVPLAQLAGIGAAQLAPLSIMGGALGQLSLTAGITSSQIASVDAGRLTGGVVPDAQLPTSIARLTSRNAWVPAAISASVETPAQSWMPGSFTLTAGIALSRTYRFNARTIGGAFTVDKAVTLAVAGPPTSAGATITRAWALTVEAGAMALDHVPVASASYGLISLGPGPWDGVTSGKFAGNSAGTYIAIDTGSSEATDYLHVQDGGTTRWRVRGLHNQASGTGNVLQLVPLITQSGTAGYNGILLNVSENAVGSGASAFLRIQKASVDQYVVSNTGDHTFVDGAALIFGTASGSKIATATGQKLGFWGHAAVAQQTVTGSRGSGAALTSLLTALAASGLIVDSSSA